MKIPKLYFPLSIAIIVAAGAVGYQFFSRPPGDSSPGPETRNNQNLAVTYSVAPQPHNNSPAETPQIKPSGNGPQAKELRQPASELKMTATAANNSPKTSPVNAALPAREAGDFNEVLEQLNETKDSAARQQLITDLINRLAQEEPRVALSVLNKIQGQTEQFQFSANYMHNLLVKDPQEAMAWVDSIQDNGWVQKNLYYALGKELVVSNDPQVLKPWLDSIDNAAMRGSAIDGIALQWSLSDPDAAYQWIKDNVPEAEAEQALAKIAQGMSKQDVP